MRRSMLVVLLLLVLAGCADRPAATPAGAYVFAGWPRLPAVLTTDDAAVPDLPASGPVGRAALIINSDRPVVVLEDGRRYRLPAAPAGEGRQGSVFPTVSPDGRWLGYRDAERVDQRRYVIRDLTGRASVVTEGYPRGWSPDARYLSLVADYGTHGSASRFDALSGSITAAEMPTPGTVWVTSLVPGPPQLRLQVGEFFAQLIRNPTDDECWCPVAVRLSPDRRVVSALLRYQPGLLAGTSDQKVHRHPEGTAQLVVIDAGTGQVTQQFPLAETGTSTWTLAADTGAGLLLWHGADTLVRMDAGSGAVEPVMRVPDARLVVLPGDYGVSGDG